MCRSSLEFCTVEQMICTQTVENYVEWRERPIIIEKPRAKVLETMPKKTFKCTLNVLDSQEYRRVPNQVLPAHKQKKKPRPKQLTKLEGAIDKIGRGCWQNFKGAIDKTGRGCWQSECKIPVSFEENMDCLNPFDQKLMKLIHNDKKNHKFISVHQATARSLSP